MRRSLNAALSLLIAGVTACNRAPQPAPAPAPAIPADAAPKPPVPNWATRMCTPEEGCLYTCVIRGAEMALVDMDYNPATGDSTYHGQPFSEAFPVTTSFAQNAEWHVNNEPITYRGRRYVKYGLPRVLAPGDVVRDGEMLGVPVFAELPVPRSVIEVIYLPVKPTCEFQPYEILGIK